MFHVGVILSMFALFKPGVVKKAPQKVKIGTATTLTTEVRDVCANYLSGCAFAPIL